MDNDALAEQYLQLKFDTRKAIFDSKMQRSLKGYQYVLRYLSIHHTLVFPKDLSDEMNISTARIASILRRMEQEGLITRCTDDTDGRKIAIKLTEKGTAYAEDTHGELVSEISRVFSAIGEEEAMQYLQILRHILEVL